MTVAFRNVDVAPGSPVESWPYEAIVTVIERGTVTDWLLLTAAFSRDPWGVVARQVEEYLGYEQPYGVGPLPTRAIARARSQAESRERAAVARGADLVARSGLSWQNSRAASAPSKSTLHVQPGSVTPSAALLPVCAPWTLTS